MFQIFVRWLCSQHCFSFKQVLALLSPGVAAKGSPDPDFVPEVTAVVMAEFFQTYLVEGTTWSEEKTIEEKKKCFRDRN